MRYRLGLVALAATLGLAAAPMALAGPVEDGNAGLDALNAGDYGRAIALFTRALNSPSLSGDDKEFAYGQRGTAYLKEGNRAAAIVDFQHALRLKPDDQDAREGLREAQSGGAGPRGGGGGGVSTNPMQDAEAGMNALNTGDASRAIILFSRAINSGRLAGDDMELALLSRGKAYGQKGAYAEAVADLNRALHIKPNDQEALDAFGAALRQMRSRSPMPGIDSATCTHNFSSVGSLLSGKSYTGFADYPGLSPLDAFAGVYTALALYTPVPGVTWQVTGANLDAGSITATITFAQTGRFISLDARIEPQNGGSRITLTESVPALLPTIDLKGSLCRTLADAPKG